MASNICGENSGLPRVKDSLGTFTVPFRIFIHLGLWASSLRSRVIFSHVQVLLNYFFWKYCSTNYNFINIAVVIFKCPSVIACCICLFSKVLATIFKMPVQNSIHKISARPDLATQLLQIVIPTTINSLLCQKGQLTLEACPRTW